jgi:hypothetical protein
VNDSSGIRPPYSWWVIHDEVTILSEVSSVEFMVIYGHTKDWTYWVHVCWLQSHLVAETENKSKRLNKIRFSGIVRKCVEEFMNATDFRKLDCWSICMCSRTYLQLQIRGLGQTSHDLIQFELDLILRIQTCTNMAHDHKEKQIIFGRRKIPINSHQSWIWWNPVVFAQDHTKQK